MTLSYLRSGLAGAALMLGSVAAWAAPAGFANQQEGDYVAKNFKFSGGETLPEVKLHYTTLGTPHKNAAGEIDNAVLALHGTTGTGKQFLIPSLGPDLFAEGAPLDVSKYYVILPDGIGRGGSSKPSDGLKAKFPRYGYADVVEGQYRLVTEGLGIKHLRLVMGTSMGGMQAWMWGERYPDSMDLIMAVASQPIQVSGRNALWRRLLIENIRNDPGYKGGDYTEQPTHFLKVLPIFNIMTESVLGLQKDAPTNEGAKQMFDKLAGNFVGKVDANDWLYWFDSSYDYDPLPALDRIKAPLLAVNFADDELNPPQLDVMNSAMEKVKQGRFVLVPTSPDTHGHQSLRYAKLWKSHLAEFMASPKAATDGANSPEGPGGAPAP
ncbi:alpha/beta fold hydrolase [Methylobacterium gnaphalii]|uniref:Homoserine O-acetyltransferase n=1 Tax=Methylobacterium gnaphalii TaxID=1010610 RepID=A0A512JMX5_9HYPH|nr:alpha/beta fold hydrolase [Methylobacterium gnaphalii]GEP11278.1 homoserine O-acetyltransferase [Methylobacterium gnaphalii]GJD70132.1 Homoserine O-acetyltransferase [Methylobacterium gnaphalii]GLS49978.1 homoserine O-acetyltransferase [Methylobacterium gnaphalii]